ncbi:MAG: ATP-binding protein, partial [Myxococcota bacterium]
RPTDYDLVLLDGTRRTYAVRASPIIWEGLAAYLLSLRDVTPRKHLARLERQVSMTDHLAHLGRVAESFGEDATGHARLMRDNYVAIHTKLSQLHNNLEEQIALRDAAFERSKNLIEEARALTDASREGLIELVGVVKNPGPARPARTTGDRTSLSQTVRDAVELIRPVLLSRDGVSLVVDLDEAFPPSRADHQAIAQAVVNLVQNAVDAVDEAVARRTTVRVTAHLRTDADGSTSAHILVEDSGHGIAVEDRTRVFSPFYTTKGIGRGTGLGLSFVADVVAEHNGSIDVRQSDLGGAAFHVTLPLGEAELTETEPDTAPDRPRVLLIHGDPLVREARRRALGPDYDVVSATDGRDLVERLFYEEHLDLIVCDVDMPHMDGPEIYEYLCEHAPSLAERIIFCVSGSVSERLRNFIELVPAPVLCTPLPRVALLEAAEELLAPGYTWAKE